MALVRCRARNKRCAFSGSSSSSTAWPRTSSLNTKAGAGGSSKLFSRLALCSDMIRSSSLLRCAVCMTWSNFCVLLFTLFSGFRRPSSSYSVVRFGRVTGVAVLKLAGGPPKSSSGRESVSESELSTMCSPLETTLLLTPELTEVCDVVGGCASGLGAWMLVGGAVEALCLKRAVEGVALGGVGPRRTCIVSERVAEAGRVLLASITGQHVSLVRRGQARNGLVPCGCGECDALSCT
jgi:hypothetical protein